MALFFSGKEADIVFFKEEGSGHLSLAIER
jgi:hypothetical protein